MMYYYNDFYPSHMFGFGPVFMLLFWVFVIYGVIWFFRKESFHNGKDHALDILKERYAKGEITKEQFESMKKDIK